MSSNPEHKLQAECVIAFSHKYPELRGFLFGNFSETRSPIEGAQKISLGLVRGVSDLIFVNIIREMIGIELKVIGSSHNRLHIIEQCHWLMKVPKVGWFCDSLEMFMSIIEGGKGIDPASVLKKCQSLKTGSVQWQNVR